MYLLCMSYVSIFGCLMCLFVACLMCLFFACLMCHLLAAAWLAASWGPRMGPSRGPNRALRGVGP